MSRVDASTAQSTSTRELLALRVAVTLQAAMALTQGVTAGQYLGSGDALNLHSKGAIVLHVIAAGQLVAAFLLWRSSRGPLWPTVVSGLSFVLGLVQAAVGDAGNLKVHVPLALVLTITIAVVLAWAWMPSAHTRTAA